MPPFHVVTDPGSVIDVVDRDTRLLGHTNVDNFPAIQPVSISSAVDVSDRAGRLLGHVTVRLFAR